MFGDFQSLKPNPDEHRIQPIEASHLGVLDRAFGSLLFNAEEVAFLRHVHGALALLNQRWFGRLRLGLDVPGCEGLHGRALDHALVGLEQSAFTRAMRDYFS